MFHARKNLPTLRPRLHSAGQFLSARIFVRVGLALTRYLSIRTNICPVSRTKKLVLLGRGQDVNLYVQIPNTCAASC